MVMMFAPSSKLSATIQAFSSPSIVATALPGNHLDTKIGITFLPSINMTFAISASF
jgi:hypothetical protein